MQKFMARFMAYSKLIVSLLFFLFFSKTPLSVYAEEASRFRFIIMGCAHIATFTPGDYELLTQNIKKHNPDFVLFFSDAVDSPDEKPMLTLGQDFYYEINKLRIPVFDFINKRQLTNSLFTPGKKTGLKENQYFFEYKNNLFIYPTPEDSIGQGGESTTESQLNFLKNTIGDTPKYNNIFLFTRGYSWFGEEREWAKIIPFLAESKIKYIFGPNMQYFGLKKKGNKYIMSKFMPCYFKRYPESPLRHFLIVDVDKHNTSIKFMPFPTSASLEKNMPSERGALDKFHIFRERERKGSLLKIEVVIDTLKIKPGMDILDIGAGGGILTLPFAEALKGTGRVFATEVRPEWIKVIKKEAEEKQLKNVFPVLVQLEGVDSFYKQHSFDIIFLCETYSALQRPKDYFRELKPSLKSGGRLYIMNRDHAINSSDFTVTEFGDFKEIIQVLISKGKNFPVFQRLGKEVQYFIESWQGEGVPSEMRTKITQGFNKIISDRWFFKDLMDYYARKDMIVIEDGRPEPAQFSTLVSDLKEYKWVIVGLDSFGVFDPPQKRLANVLEEPLRMFNRRLLTRTFDRKQAILLHIKNRTISEMESSGYEFVQEYDFNKDYYFLEFKSRP